MIVERPALERRILDSLEAGRIPVVLGGCGSGRSSLLLRMQQILGERGQYLDFAAAATTPERCFESVVAVSRLQPATHAAGGAALSPRAAFDSLLTFFDRAATGSGRAPVFLIDEFLDLRTFENFPGLRHVLRDSIARLGTSPAQFVLASRFTARTHRLLRDAPARFEVVHVPGLTAAEAQSLAARLDGNSGAGRSAATVAALAAGRAAYAHILIETMASMGSSVDPVAALATGLACDGRLTARCRESYELRLHRARGYGALKAILGVLADNEPMNLTEISHALHRTPGSTKDYLSWLEDVDLIAMHGKRYSYEDPLVRVFVRLHARPTPPADTVVLREVRAYAQPRLAVAAPAAAAAPAPVAVAAERAAEAGASGIIEID
jgi:hypothetical protein